MLANLQIHTIIKQVSNKYKIIPSQIVPLFFFGSQILRGNGQKIKNGSPKCVCGVQKSLCCCLKHFCKSPKLVRVSPKLVLKSPKLVLRLGRLVNAGKLVFCIKKSFTVFTIKDWFVFKTVY